MKLTKVIFIGPADSENTAVLHTISDIPPVMTAAPPGDGALSSEPGTGATLDYGLIKLKSGEQIHLYMAAGDNQLELLPEHLAGAGVGLILLLDNTSDDPFKEMFSCLDLFKAVNTRSNIAIGITQMDISEKPTIADYHVQMQVSGMKPPIFAVDPMSKKDMSLLVQALLYSVDPMLAQ
jgi:uncharacterized protein